jgi:multimeric flavodoxin WrbA
VRSYGGLFAKENRMKMVLGLISSPRTMGNSEIMTKEIMSHTGRNNRFKILRMHDLNIEPCMACYSCKKGKKCPRDDDMEFLLSTIAEADGIIISSPVYSWGANIGIQRMLDRFFVFSKWLDVFAHKPCVTFVTYGVPYEDGYALSVLNALAREMNLEVKETASFLGSSPGEVLKYTRNMDLAKLLGRALFDISYQRENREFECPNCFSNIVKFRSDTYLQSPEVRRIGELECAFCGTVAELKSVDGKISLTYLNRGLYTEGTRERLDQFHRETLESFAKEKGNIRRLTEKYRKMGVEIGSKGG